MIRRCQAIVTIQRGKGLAIQHALNTVESYELEESIDNDADTFSVTVGDTKRLLEDALDRDNEVRVNLFINDAKNKLIPIFTGIADTVSRDSEYTMTISGRDIATSLAIDSDAVPQRWKNLYPAQFIQQRAHTLGIARTQVAKMSPVKTIFTDGTETEWSFWYRLARMRDMYMWTNHMNGGTLYVDKLGYSLSPSYLFGDPPRGQARNAWLPVEDVSQTSTKQGRKRRVIIYGDTAKKGKTVGRSLVQQAVDTTIPSWKKKPTQVLTSTKDKSPKALHDKAGVEIFESLVGAVEHLLTIHDQGQFIQQNKMCRVNLPAYGLVGNFFIVGVQRAGGVDGMTQIVRVREKGFALSKRVPDAPTLAKTGTSVSDDYKPASSIGAALAASGQVRWADSFVRATREYGVTAGWDFAVFLGTLLAMCDKETGFRNVRQTYTGSKPAESNVEWYGDPADQVTVAQPPDPSTITVNRDPEFTYHSRFANEHTNNLNPFSPNEAGVGPMQLTTLSYKQFADNLGWNGAPNNDEYHGGRWNPDSNIRAAAKVLADKGKENPPADPTNADDIWIAVQRYNGSGEAAVAYAADVKKRYDASFGPTATAAVSLPKSIPPGSSDTNVNIPGHGVIALPAATPIEIRKAIAFAYSKLGDPYHFGGDGSWVGGMQEFDCSSFVTAALAAGAPYLKNELNYPFPGNHGETTYSLFTQGRFPAVTKDNLLPGDLVFFTGSDGTQTAPGHVGMYLGDNLFIQDPNSGDVVKVSSLGEDYYVQTYVGARRIAVWTQRPG